MEYLDRGLVAFRKDEKAVFMSWRKLATDHPDTRFIIYRKIGGGSGVMLSRNSEATNFVDSLADWSESITYSVVPVLQGKQLKETGTYTLPANAPIRQYLPIAIKQPPGGMTGTQKYSYNANDLSVGDLDNDGIYELILKWDPSNARNPPQTGITANTFLDAYRQDGTLLWRIDLGKNIRSGAAYTQFLVYDFNGDGKSEMICKTADGTIDGKGKVIGDSTKDWRTLSTADSRFYGKIVNGPEYLTVFDGVTGSALSTVTYTPSRYPLDGWGGIGGNGGNDSTGSRSDRFTACVAYLDGKLPSAVMVRGWYGRTVLSAWDFRNGKLTQRWIFDSKDKDNPYSGMANHNLSVADVDSDGKDEICVGAMTVDDNGKGLYTTGLRHGDAVHLSDMDLSNPGLEVFGIHENEDRTIALNTPGVAMFDARTGKVLWSLFPGVDVGRGVAADIDPTHAGFENWGGPGGLRNNKGKTITNKVPSSQNFVVWWDADLTRELLDKNRIDKWDWKNETTINLLTAEDCVSNNGTKATPALSGDLLGDWREEVIWRTEDNKELRIYSTVIPTSYSLPTLMHDPQYRLSIVWQNVSYNQPPHTSFFLGQGMKMQPKPNIVIKTPTSKK
ncbi:rhamnogalacturonan lyase [Paradesertivirga mongoliensis]|uniref:Rhamnogalacturonan lyase n=2 Tax=Paradesertivirga mongoliensis TaxID=2100740 RepID=A0ABW4ZJS4_9SPHI|nr:rhamnogalacturonan lyase [Pedobacter mongoliensis]